jgi:hypothetical protein
VGDRVGARVGVGVEVAGVGAADVAEDHAGVVLRCQGEHLLVVPGPGEVEDAGPGLEGGLHDARVVGLDRDDDAVAGKPLDDGDELLDLLLGGDVLGVVLDRLRAHVDEVRALRDLQAAEAQGGVGADGDGLAVPAVLGQVDHAHDRRLDVGVDLAAARRRGQPERRDRCVEQVAVFLDQPGQAAQVDHWSSPCCLLWSAFV